MQHEADQRVALALERGQQAQNLLRLAAGGERDDHIAGQQHAQVAVDGFGGVQKQGRRAGGAERGGDLLGDDAALAHAGDDDAAVALAAAKDQARRRGSNGSAIGPSRRVARASSAAASVRTKAPARQASIEDCSGFADWFIGF